MRKLWNNHANNLHRLSAVVAQTLCNDIWKEMMFLSKSLDSSSRFLTNAWTIFKCTRYCSHGNTKLSGYIFHCYGRRFFHGCSSVTRQSYANLQKVSLILNTKMTKDCVIVCIDLNKVFTLKKPKIK